MPIEFTNKLQYGPWILMFGTHTKGPALVVERGRGEVRAWFCLNGEYEITTKD